MGNVHNSELMNYITIYEVAKLVGRDPDKLRDRSVRKRFAKYVQDLGGVRFVKSDLFGFEQTQEYPKDEYLYSCTDLSIFLTNHMRMSDALNYISVPLTTFSRLVSALQVYVLGSTRALKFYSKQDIDNLYREIYFDIEEYMSIYEFGSVYFGKANPSFIWRLRDCIDALPDELFTRKPLAKEYHDVKNGRYIKVVYSRKDVKGFFANHISKEEVFKHLIKLLDIKTLRRIYNDINPVELNLGGKLATTFISIVDYASLTEAVHRYMTECSDKEQGILSDGEFYSRKQAMSLLKVGIRTIKKMETEKLLTVVGTYKSAPYYVRGDVEQLIVKQQKILSDMQDGYFSSQDIRELYGDKFCNFITRITKHEQPVRHIDVPIVLKGHYGEAVNRYLYFKQDVIKAWDKYRLSNDFATVSCDNPFEEFKYKVEGILSVKFSDKQINTKELWYDFCRRQVINSTRINLQEYINICVHTTANIALRFEKEVYSYSSLEINTRFLNEKSSVPRNQQREFYRFLKKLAEAFVAQGLPLPFDVDALNDPTMYERIVEHSLDIYGLDEYHALYDYVQCVDYHKRNAIEDVQACLRTGDTSSYKKYDSCWLYVLIQLTNNWRHSTVISQIPRVDLSNTNIQSLEWLETHSPSVEDAERLVLQVGRYVRHINKTGVVSEALFTIGEPLKIAFATAISICEFRTRATEDNSPILIRLTGGTNVLSRHLNPYQNPHLTFFKNFNREFVFENRKMNRTLTTLIWSVLRQLGTGLAEAQLSRDHLRDDTTIDHYIKLSETQCEDLVLQLFERGQFGHATQVLATILFGEQTDKNLETVTMTRVQEHFGGPLKIEATAGLMNTLSKRKRDVQEHLESLPILELSKMYQRMLAGSLPSREMHYQCIFASCKYMDDFGNKPPCETCPAAIINVYALSQLMDTYQSFMTTIIQEFDSAPLGEQRKLANHFHMLHLRVIEARQAFGRKIVDDFVDGGSSRLSQMGKFLSSKQLKALVSSQLLEKKGVEVNE